MIVHVFFAAFSMYIYLYMVADHRMTAIVCVNKVHVQAAPLTVTKIDQKKVSEYLSTCDWNKIKDYDCPNTIYNFIRDNFSNAYKNASSTLKFNSQKTNRSGEPWINRSINKLCEHKNKLYQKLRKDSNNKLLRLQYNKIRNRANKMLHQCKNNYFKNEFKINHGNSRRIWELLNRITGRIKPTLDEAIKNSFSYLLTDEEIANKFSTEFNTNVQTTIPKCKSPILDETSYLKPTNASIRFKKVTAGDVHKIIKTLKPKKAAGIDGIKTIDVINLAQNISIAIAKLINTSIRQGHYPDELKEGCVRPIHKGGKRDDVGKYRPITILSCIDKIVEKAVCKQMQEFYGKHDVLTKLQYGFQPNKSCTQLLSDFTDSVNAHLNDKKHVFALFIDYSKAFDVLDHKKLSQKLHASGIRGPLLKWCDSYVANRCSYVKICNSLSKRSVATHGTAQGSVIGPLHFLVYVNDLVNVLKHCQVYQFADDTCIISADRNVKDAISKLQKDFDRLCMWSHDSGLVLNAQKTKMVHIHSPHIKNDQLIELKAHSHSCLHLRTQSCKCESIELVKSQRYLGLVIDEHFSWGPHIDEVNNRLRAILAKIYIIRNRLTFHTLMTLYKALVEPVVDYGLSSYGRTFKSYLEPLLNLQTRIIKNIVGPKIKNKFRENCNGLFKHCGVLPVDLKFKYVLLKEQFFNQEIQKPISHKIFTRKIANNFLKIPKHNNYYGKRITAQQVPIIINSIPNEIRKKITPLNIKIKLKEFFLQSLENN